MTEAAFLPSWVDDLYLPTTALRLLLGIGLVLIAVPLASRATGVWLEQRRWSAYLRHWVSSQPNTAPCSPSLSAGLVLLSHCLCRSSTARARAWVGAALLLGAHAALLLVIAVVEERLSQASVLRLVHWALCSAHLLALPALWISTQSYRQRLKETRVAERVLGRCQGKPLSPRPPGELISLSFELETSVVLNAALFSILTDALDIESHWSRLGSFAGFEFSPEACREELSQLEVDVCSLEVALVELSGRDEGAVPALRVKAERSRVLRKVSMLLQSSSQLVNRSSCSYISPGCFCSSASQVRWCLLC